MERARAGEEAADLLQQRGTEAPHVGPAGPVGQVRGDLRAHGPRGPQALLDHVGAREQVPEPARAVIDEGDRERENRFDSLGSSGRLSLWCDCSVDGSSGVVVGAAVIMMENADSASRVSPSR